MYLLNSKMKIFSIFFNSSSISSVVMEEFHDFTNLILLMIMLFISSLIMKMIMSNFTNYNFKENMNLEVIWTLIPMFILLLIAYPSIYYLYLFDMSMNPTVLKKVFGAQWYWIYESFDNIKGKSFSSYMINELEQISLSNYKLGWRLLETDNRLVVPYLMELQIILTSLDVIHSFSIAELGIKIDAIPGRLNSINMLISKPGVYYGQCSEICGTGHAFMPICLEAI